METEFELIAKTFQGLENVLAKELTDLGANNIQTGRRMVSFTGDKELMYRANFALRTAIRILKPIKHFKAESADQVYDAVKAIDWNQYLDNETSFAVDSVVFSQEFRHSKFVAYKVKDAIVDYFREKTGSRPNISVTHPDLQLNIHIAENDCTLSLDSSGESLHRRGYRQEAVEAPLNEVLAAGMILMTGWDGECDLIDPMCGSGTIAIEAALIARGIAPGVFRKEYAFEKWPDFDKEMFDRIYNDESQEREFTHKIYGYDINRRRHRHTECQSCRIEQRDRNSPARFPQVYATGREKHHHHQSAVWRTYLHARLVRAVPDHRRTAKTPVPGQRCLGSELPRRMFRPDRPETFHQNTFVQRFVGMRVPQIPNIQWKIQRTTRRRQGNQNRRRASANGGKTTFQDAPRV